MGKPLPVKPEGQVRKNLVHTQGSETSQYLEEKKQIHSLKASGRPLRFCANGCSEL